MIIMMRRAGAASDMVVGDCLLVWAEALLWGGWFGEESVRGLLVL